MRAGITRIVVALLVAAGPLAAHAFIHLEVGDPLPERELPVLDGGTAPLLGRARATVFAFFRPGQNHSEQVLRQLAKLEEEFAGKAVRFVAVTSASYDADAVREVVRASGIRMPVLLDRDDALYGELGVKMHPTVGIADAAHRLAAYQPFRRINMLDALRARISGVLGELGPDEVAAAVMPPRVEIRNAEGKARTQLAMARLFLSRGQAEKAAESARAACELAPSLPEAHASLALALAAAGRCDEAREEHAAAAELGAAGGALPGCDR